MSHFLMITDESKKLPFYLASIGSDAFQIPLHRRNGHPFHHILFIKDGSGTFVCDENTYHVNAGDVIFIKKSIPHAYYANGNVFETEWITFDGIEITTLLSYYNISTHKVFKPENYSDLTNSLHTINAKVESGASDDEISPMIYSLMIATFNCEKITDTEQSLKTVIDYIKLNFNKCLTLDELAELIKMNRYTFCKEFKKIYKISPFDYILQTRIQHAKSLLKDTDLQVNEIAQQCGFNDSCYFCRIFKRYENRTPAAFRAFTRTSI